MAILRRKITNVVKNNKSRTTDLSSLIQQRAYSIFEKRGYAHGNDMSDWFEAERQVRAELGRR